MDAGGQVNPEGLEWEEWAYAAGLDPVAIRLMAQYTGWELPSQTAWRRGEDPTEWRAGVEAL